MNEQSNKIYSIKKDNKPIKGCTLSKTVCADEYYISYFSLASDTDISAEVYTYHKLMIVNEGVLTAYAEDKTYTLKEGDIFLTPKNIPVGIKTNTGGIYTEITLKENTVMNEILKAGEIFSLKDMVPYAEGKIVNMDLIKDPKLKFVLMSFDEGTGLSEHAAPGEAIIFALDGEAIIGYEGKEYRISAGENFKFDKMGKHYVTADHKFKMALLLKLD